ncbi:isoaspartyl peptidase/L-asparaginase [Pantoea ananatis]
MGQLQRALGSDTALLDHDGAAQGGDPLDPDRKFGTVGAVALDNDGNLAAATSTGGMTNKQVGHVATRPYPVRVAMPATTALRCPVPAPEKCLSARWPLTMWRRRCATVDARYNRPA